MNKMVRIACVLVCQSLLADAAVEARDVEILLSSVSSEPVRLNEPVDDSGDATWLLPDGMDELIVPFSGGVIVDRSRPEMMQWLRGGSPWELRQLPVVGARYGEQIICVILPWPHYAELVVDDRVGIRFSFPPGRRDANPCDIVVVRCDADPLGPALEFRKWRRTAAETGLISRPRSLTEKIETTPKVSRLVGAPHIYLWGPPQFSRHDVARQNWLPFAKKLQAVEEGSVASQVVATFADEQKTALNELATAKWPMRYLTTQVASGIQDGLRRLSDRDAIRSDAGQDRTIERAFASEFADVVRPPHTWGDGMSVTLLNELSGAGIDRALLLQSNLNGDCLRPDVTMLAESRGYLVGPYDSYHSVHSPDADTDNTWETAQFGHDAFEKGRVIRADGTGHAGFRGRGFHFAPGAAWPYVVSRVGKLQRAAGYSTWFVDCDATGECFDDFSPQRQTTRNDDSNSRRERLSWLESEHGLVVGSEGGSVLFSDVIHFGHGVHTPYIGHLAPEFRQRDDPHFLGRHWPPDTPEQSFKSIPLPAALRTPFFDPAVRIPLYQAALGDEVIVTHHWSFDSFKFSNVAETRELLEILYMVPPLYHLNREAWPDRKDRIVRHFQFWSPLHREVALAPLTKFECLTKDRLLQRTTFRKSSGDVMITANFSQQSAKGLPPMSVRVSGQSSLSGRVYSATE